MRISLVVLLLASGCQSAGPSGLAGVELTPPGSWRRVEKSRWMVPGTPLAAWSGPDGSSLVLYRTLPIPGGSAAMIVEALANRMDHLPDLRVEVKRTETVGGTTAARVEVVASGTGDALAPSGIGTPIAPTGKTLVPTRQVTLGFPRRDETLYLTWNLPQSSRDRIEPDIRTTLDSLRFARGAMNGSPSRY